MAREITHIILSVGEEAGDRLDGVGGEGWTKRAATVVAEIEAGNEYFIRVDGDVVAVRVGEHEGRRYLCSDPERTGGNDLLSLPTRR